MINDVQERMSRFFRKRILQLSSMRSMWHDERVQCYNDKDLPSSDMLQDVGSIFLAGPTSRHQLIEYNWRSSAVCLLRKADFQGFIFVPEPRGEEESGDFVERDFIHRWESSRLLSSSRVLFWIPRKGDELLGLNTNLELGIFIGRTLLSCDSSGVFIGWPDGAERMGLPEHYAVELAGFKRYRTLEELCLAVARKKMFQASF